ncbi:hypothetical protein ABZ508_26470 [Streptomyces lavendulocolor]|uniref:Uncharacterized protein n=1 Tax=Streptomyces lavendulocolor TaxID=67316 RepID=A0ABV2WC60_9ACTN
MTPATAIVSQLLCELPDSAPPVQQQVGQVLVRALGLVDREPADEKTAADYAASLAAGYVETDLDAWYAAAIARRTTS